MDNIKTLENEILNFFYNNQDQIKSVNDIYADLKQKNIKLDSSEEKSVFKIGALCNILNKKNDKIFRIHSNKYFIYTDNYDSKKHDFDINNDLDSNKQINYMNILEDLLDNPVDYAFIHINDKLDGYNNAYHLCCQQEDSNYLKKLFNYYEIDTSLVNEFGKTGLDISLENNLAKNVNLINNYDNENINNNLKLINKKLQAEYNSLNTKMNDLKIDNAQKTNFLIILWCLMFSLTLIIYETKFLLYLPFTLNPAVIFGSFCLIFLQIFLDRLLVNQFNYSHVLILLIFMLPAVYNNLSYFF